MTVRALASAAPARALMPFAPVTFRWLTTASLAVGTRWQAQDHFSIHRPTRNAHRIVGPSHSDKAVHRSHRAVHRSPAHPTTTWHRSEALAAKSNGRGRRPSEPAAGRRTVAKRRLPA